jgi:hypothetical protein
MLSAPAMHDMAATPSPVAVTTITRTGIDEHTEEGTYIVRISDVLKVRPVE